MTRPSSTASSGWWCPVEDLSASIWLWHQQDGQWAATKVISIPGRARPRGTAAAALQAFGAVPPLITDIGLSVDDRFLYVSCWGTGEMKQYDVTDPLHPRETGSVRIGGIVGRAPHPARPGQPLTGGPQMVEVSRDGKRVYFTNSLYGSWDEQFYPDGVGAWMTKLDAGPDGGIAFDENFFLEGDVVPRPPRAPGPARGRRRLQRLLLLLITPPPGSPACQRPGPPCDPG